MITVIDYGAGNLRSVENALRHLRVPYVITSVANVVASARALLLPGVGHFGQMMRSLELLGLVPVLRKAIAGGVPYLGICLGMHALYERSEEAPSWPGLDILRGTVRRFPEGLKVPHMGWNRLQTSPGSRLFESIDGEPFVYFAHSYYVPEGEMTSQASAAAPAAALTDYGCRFVAAVEKDAIYGVQFHPEKSGESGLRILHNFCDAGLGQASRKSPPRRS
jgi:imidazole glycerol phosphate synthase glutamine amidotransferase subunit